MVNLWAEKSVPFPSEQIQQHQAAERRKAVAEQRAARMLTRQREEVPDA